MNKDKTIRIDYDDLSDDIVEKINKLLVEYNLKLQFDGEYHDGFEILSLTKK